MTLTLCIIHCAKTLPPRSRNAATAIHCSTKGFPVQAWPPFRQVCSHHLCQVPILTLSYIIMWQWHYDSTTFCLDQSQMQLDRPRSLIQYSRRLNRLCSSVWDLRWRSWPSSVFICHGVVSININKIFWYCIFCVITYATMQSYDVMASSY